jgi:hypothetical protein
MAYSQQFNPGSIVHQSTLNFGASQSMNNLSSVSVKDDARDLLEKYSEMLLETLKKKMEK